MDGILTYIVVGLIVGVAARLVMPGSDPIGIIGTIVVGIVGAIVGGYLWRQLFGNTEDVEWIGSILVAMALLWIYRRATIGRRTFV
ncbi:MAG: GlsB/YeaQ/YmgE family stress response membrane protein [Actinomycetota bacterium]